MSTDQSQTQNNTQIFIGRLPEKTTDMDLYSALSPYGEINFTRLIKPRNNAFNQKCAFVSFKDSSAALRAKQEMNGEEFLGKHITVSLIYNSRKQEANVFVKNFPAEVKARELEEQFSGFGTIISCVIIYDQNERSLRYGFIQFEASESADAAIKAMDGQSFRGETLSVSKFLPINQRTDEASANNLYVRGFPPSTTEAELKKRFSEFGEVTSVAVIKQNLENENTERAFGFVCFGKPEEAETARNALHGKTEGNTAWLIVPHMNKRARIRKLQEDYSKKVEQWKKTNVFISGLPKTIDQNKLRDICKAYGKVEELKLITTKNITYAQGQSVEDMPTGKALVCYSTPEQAANAIKSLQNIMIEGNKLITRAWKPKEERVMNQQNFAQKQFMMMMPGFYPHQMNWGRGGRARGRGFSGRGRGMPGMRPPMQPPVAPRGQPPVPRGQPSAPRAQPSAPRAHPSAPRPQPAPRAQPAPAPQSDINRRQTLGEKLYPTVINLTNSQIAGKITGMLLEMNLDLVDQLLQNPTELKTKVSEAVEVLRSAWASDPEKLKMLPN